MKKSLPIVRSLLTIMKITILQLIVAALFSGIVTAATESYGQGVLDKTLSIKANGRQLEDILLEIEKAADVRFSFNPKSIPLNQRISGEFRDARLGEVLDKLFAPLKMTYEVSGGYIILSGSAMNNTTGQTGRSGKEADIAVSGRVTDESNNPLPGVNIVEKGTTNGTTTDVDGRFILQIAGESSILVFSFIGYEKQEIIAGSTTQFSVVLKTDVKSLDEVVIVGYGTVKKSDLTGSVAQVKTEELTAFPATNVLQALSGRAAGVQVLQNTGAPGAGVSVRIRGTNSVQGSNEPLYVVDGFPIAGNNPSILNNNDIESIEILKDASATAIYGSRGANGVVLITTKKGSAGKTQVDVETSYSTQSLVKKLELMNATEYAMFVNETRANDNLAPYFTQEQIDSFGKGFDWQELIFRKAPMKTLTVTVNGGSEKTKFSLSGSTFNQEGIVKGSDYNRHAFRTNINHEISKMFSLSLTSILTKVQSNGKNSGGGNRGGSMIAATISSPPTLTPYNDDGTYRNMLTAYPFISNSLANPINFIKERSDVARANMVLTNAALLFKPIPELTVKILGGIENTDTRNDTYVSVNYVNSQGSASVSSTQYTSLLSENTVSYDKKFADKHGFTAVAGYTWQNFISTSLSGSGVGFLSDATESYELQGAATPGIPNTGYSKSVLKSFLARVNYSFDDRYLVTISGRADGSSKYSPGNKWGYFPSAAFAWKISNEKFFNNNSAISDLKVRTSWGKTGSQAINAYATLNQLFAGKTTFDKSAYPAYAPGTRLPGDLRWETTEQRDIGIDIGLFRNRLLLTADYYVKNTSDLLNTVVLPPTSGFTTTIQNVGEVQNKGFEFGVDAVVLDGDFKWDVSANIALNRNKVIKLYDGIDILGGNIDVNAVQDYANILRQGRPIGQFWGYVEQGYSETGQIVYKDLDDSGSITIADKTYIGDPNPDYIFGVNTRLSYKNFELSVFLQGVQGNDLLNISSINNTIDYGIGLNMPREVFHNHWTPENPNAKYPKPSISTKATMSDRFVEDGSYVRLKNIQLAYNLPVDALELDWLRSFQVYISGQNLLTFTKYSWWDPEVNSQGGPNSVNQGLDYFSYPMSKAVTVGLRAGF